MPRTLQHPARLVPLTFLLAVVLGTGLLMLPAARAGEGAAPFLTALFTAVSAVCVSGLITVDTPTYWSGLGQGVILALFQVGGVGIMSGATLLGLLVARRLRLSTRLVAQAETRCLELGDVADVLRLVLLATIAVELATAAVLALRLRFAYGEPWAEAAWNGLFLAVSAFSNAGFSTYSDNLMGFAPDPFVLGPIAAAVVLGGIGFPVLHDLRRNPRRAARWSLHTKLTLFGTGLLLLGGTAAVLAYEWNNPATLGPLGPAGKLLGAAFHSAQTRSAGFNALDVGGLRPETLAVSYVLMMIGGGSAGTAGGIKVTTFLVLGFVVWAEIRGEPDVCAFGRRISRDVQRQALAVALLAVGFVGIATLALLSVSDLALHDALFESVSAFASVGLSTGVTAALPPAGQAILVVLMFLGRVGTITVATGIALQSRQRPYRYPEERPIVG
ncbi:MAG: KtrAB potassium uptake system, integral membrane component KtrB [uncultured Acetobacteraceae bacterium]|uniref:KtrAB potassium uptake system, integral membrane component KtrB n=1 Tax=uncultured Acetobacteraceae bacterium TaxID=169975 RepID=A0A6J4JLQ5_9PROT|nr:MAG: KtrAB potassium uptake system, integral membrane component KtrB [uncultured Acetobacteraceae bacterium]